MKINYRLIIGLGNPDLEYKDTFHNIGFLAVDYFTKDNSEKDFENPKLKKFQYLKFKQLIFVKTLTFMNQSGKAVEEAAKYFKIKPAETLIIHDDSDIEFGNYKISFAKNSAGHKGIESIFRALKTKDIWRLRIGIRKNKKSKASDMVLKKINKNDLVKLKNVFRKIDKEVFS